MAFQNLKVKRTVIIIYYDITVIGNNSASIILGYMIQLSLSGFREFLICTNTIWKKTKKIELVFDNCYVF